ncbi:MAG: protein kinase family protein, partial [Oligoflexia bacterium]|nr:protein kinase family protein [Oligoflexia bacterium]
LPMGAAIPLDGPDLLIDIKASYSFCTESLVILLYCSDRCLQRINMAEECSRQGPFTSPTFEEEIKADKLKMAIEAHGHVSAFDVKDTTMCWTKLIEYTIFPETFPIENMLLLKNGNDMVRPLLLLKAGVDFIFDTGVKVGSKGTYKTVTWGLGLTNDHLMNPIMRAVLHLNIREEYKESLKQIYRDSIQREHDTLRVIGLSRGIVSPMTQINRDLYLQEYYADGDFHNRRIQVDIVYKLSNNMIGDLLAGLNQIHQAGFAHLDIKTTNIMLNSDSALIADLGNSQQLDQVAGVNPGKTTSANYIDPYSTARCVPRSVQTTSRGTPNIQYGTFRAFANAEEAKAADVYALGLVLLESEFPEIGAQLSLLNACYNSWCSPDAKIRNPVELCNQFFSNVHTIAPGNNLFNNPIHNHQVLVLTHHKEIAHALGVNAKSILHSFNISKGNASPEKNASPVEIDVNKNTLLWLMSHPLPNLRPSSKVASCIWEKIRTATPLAAAASAAAAGSVKVKIVNEKFVCDE